MENITKKLHIKRTVLFAIIIFWMVLVYCLSNQNSVDSTETSVKFLNFLVSMFAKIVNKDLNIEDFMWLDYTLRKFAHFGLYFVGAIPVFSLLKTYNIGKVKQIVLTVLFCACYACSDELHQLFSEGRNGNFIDVLIDTTGSAFGIIFVEIVLNIVYKLKNRRKN